MLTESAIEAFAIKLFERLGYTYLHGPDIAPDSDNPARASYAEVMLLGKLTQAALRINHKLPANLVESALKEVQRAHSPTCWPAMRLSIVC
jgi:type I restriction enzyme R subunit